jgi:hypothetical protein
MSAQTTIVLQGAATCEDDFFDEIGGYRVTLSEHDLSQIEALRCAVRAVAAYRITNWCWSAEWFATDPTDTEDDELSAERVDTGQMHVTADGSGSRAIRSIRPSASSPIRFVSTTCTSACAMPDPRDAQLGDTVSWRGTTGDRLIGVLVGRSRAVLRSCGAGSRAGASSGNRRPWQRSSGPRWMSGLTTWRDAKAGAGLCFCTAR